ncbi:hypothetical protein GCM10010112_67870 [Actinoplanes lobatus]|uniref:DUF4082 domain-containing protein n=1 Tax=Actinoplanes lobatus TaxID=113568 RepID=A0A7W7MGB5_9ACTN|nr:DUF4082 domain-containing protein [Actinoplanes lobatus]MBB4749133.1 hypothetical protein [Actinoplanes lobatus]GGN86372.1 hypothetical protein GCM10010112_67870 [Actinoplanes lobatus]GIE42769.1 hypothetical protein Alo02nite_56670 [Actinoplanes lobatus]
MPATSTVTDTFPGPSLSVPPWDNSYGADVSAGRGRVPVSQTGGTPDFAGILSEAIYSLDTVYAEVTAAAAAGASDYCLTRLAVLSITDGTNLACSIDAVSGDLRFESNVGYFDGGAASVTYSATTHKWLKIEKTGGNIVWSTAPDGTTWTSRRTLAAPVWTSDTDLRLIFEAQRGSGTANFAFVDNFNTLGIQSGSGTLAGTGTLTGTATADRAGTATLAGTGALAGTAVLTGVGTATMTGTGALAGTATRDAITTATLTGTGALTGTAARETSTTADLAGTGTLTATGVRTQEATATLAATGGLTAAGERTQAAAATLAATGTLTAAGERVQEATATLAATGALASSGLRTTDATATLAATGALTADGEIPGQVQHVFTDQVPTITDADDGTPGITFGTTVRATVDGYATGVRWYTTDTVSGTYIGALYQVDAADDPTPAGTELAQKTLAGPPSAGGWNSITFDSPVPITAGVLYRPATHSSAGRYVYSAGVHDSDIVNGDLVADAAGDDPAGLGTLRQATFTIGVGLSYPATGAGSNGGYFVDLDFVAGDTPVEGSATLAATGGLTAAGDRTAVTTATLAATGTLTAAGERVQPATAVLAGTGGLTATATLTAVDTGLLAAVATLTGVGARETSTTATLAAVGTLTATATVVPPVVSSPTSTLRTTSRPPTLSTASRPRTLSTGRPPT